MNINDFEKLARCCEITKILEWKRDKNEAIDRLIEDAMDSTLCGDLYSYGNVISILEGIWSTSDPEVVGHDNHGYVTEFYNNDDLCIMALNQAVEEIKENSYA